MFRHYLFATFTTILFLFLTGCASTSDIFNLPYSNHPPANSSVAREAATIRRTEAKVTQLEAQFDEINRQLGRIERRLDDLERKSFNPNDATALRRDIDAIRQDMTRQRSEIINELATKLTKIQPSSPARTSSATKRSTAKSGYEHIVEKGQTLSEIARGYGVTVDSILKANNLTRRSVIRVGQTLFIPDAN